MRIEGLDEFIRSLNLAPSQLSQARQAFGVVAADTVRDMAVALGHANGGVAKKAADDLRVAGPGLVELGGRPYDLGAEFGSYQYHQFDRWRGKDDSAGYFFWPAVRDFRDNIMTTKWFETAWRIVAALKNSH